MSEIKVIAFDLDGTLTQHKSPLCDENKAVLDRLAKKYKLLMVGAGTCRRIFEQMGRYPIDIVGNYGLQSAKYEPAKKDIVITRDTVLACDKKSVEERVACLREKYGYTEFQGNAVEYHTSGCVTFPILGTKATLEDKLNFDPHRLKRRKIYEDVKATFSEYTVFVGGSSSFDMAPKPFNKYYALDAYCKENGLSHKEVAYVGDDYGLGGNDEVLYLSDFIFVTIDDYIDFPHIMKNF